MFYQVKGHHLMNGLTACLNGAEDVAINGRSPVHSLLLIQTKCICVYDNDILTPVVYWSAVDLPEYVNRSEYMCTLFFPQERPSV